MVKNSFLVEMTFKLRRSLVGSFIPFRIWQLERLLDDGGLKFERIFLEIIIFCLSQVPIKFIPHLNDGKKEDVFEEKKEVYISGEELDLC